MVEGLVRSDPNGDYRLSDEELPGLQIEREALFPFLLAARAHRLCTY
jgi:hypothetical protein